MLSSPFPSLLPKLWWSPSPLPTPAALAVQGSSRLAPGAWGALQTHPQPELPAPSHMVRVQIALYRNYVSSPLVSVFPSQLGIDFGCLVDQSHVYVLKFSSACLFCIQGFNQQLCLRVACVFIIYLIR